MQKAKNQKRGPGKAADRKAALSAQQTIPYLVMHPDGVCQLPGGLYTKTVEYEDINYSVASTEDQTAIFGGWSSFLNYEDIELMTEALYHINCDYLLSDYLQWPMYDTKRENPFRPYFELWKMGLNIYFPERGRVVLIG